MTFHMDGAIQPSLFGPAHEITVVQVPDAPVPWFAYRCVCGENADNQVSGGHREVQQAVGDLHLQEADSATNRPGGEA